MSLKLSQFTKSIGFHTLFWIGVWFYYMYFFSYSSNNQSYAFWFSTCLMPVTMITTYVVTSYLIPHYLVIKKLRLFVLYIIYTMIISSYVVLLSIFGCFILLTEAEMGRMPPLSRDFWFVLALVYLVVIAVSSLRIMQLGDRNLSIAQSKEKELLQRDLFLKDQELSLLKKQIHPHFLFNSLNTIYSLAVRQADHTPEVILKLSNLLDYLLYQSGKHVVSLQKELDHLHNYISLEKVRFHDSLIAHFDIDRVLEPLELPPMLLLPLVENAFKHGVLIDDILTIQIVCTYEDKRLYFGVTNSANSNQKTSNEGLGISTLIKRLNLLYPQRHTLTSRFEHNCYLAELTLLHPQNIQHGEV